VGQAGPLDGGLAANGGRQHESQGSVVRRRCTGRGGGLRLDRASRRGGGDRPIDRVHRGSAFAAGSRRTDRGTKSVNDARTGVVAAAHPGVPFLERRAGRERRPIYSRGSAPQVSDNPKPLNEASTRAFFLDKVFDALGYSEFDDIEHGSVVQTGDFPDYVLHAGGMPAIAVEAKKIDHPLGPKEAGQVVKYCSVLGLRWGLLTNGRLFQIYDAPVTGIAPEDRLVLEIDLNDWADREDFDLRRWSEATMLTKAAMETGDALERYAAREMIRTLLLDPSARTVKALRKELEGKKVVLSEPTITSLIGELLT
jgi:hypothetical protein